VFARFCRNFFTVSRVRIGLLLLYLVVPVILASCSVGPLARAHSTILYNIVISKQAEVARMLGNIAVGCVFSVARLGAKWGDRAVFVPLAAP